MLKTICRKFSTSLKLCSFIEQKVGIIGVPFGKGGPNRGAVEHGPDVIRKGGLINHLTTFLDKSNIIDYGNVEYDVITGVDASIPNMKNYHHIVPCILETSKQVQKVLQNDQICLTLGGDHSIAVGTVDGHIKAKKNICVLYIDAHADLNTNKTSESGNVHGMPLALLASELSDYWPYLPGMDWQKPVLSLRNVAYIGLRSVDPYERMVIDKLGISAFGMADIEEYGIASVVEMALKSIDPEKNKSVHVSFDIDALDTLEAPSTVLSIRGGLTLREAMHIMEMVYDTGNLSAIDIVEVNPGFGNEADLKKTVDAAISIISAGLGCKRHGMRLKNASLPLQTYPPTRPEII